MGWGSTSQLPRTGWASRNSEADWKQKVVVVTSDRTARAFFHDLDEKCMQSSNVRLSIVFLDVEHPLNMEVFDKRIENADAVVIATSPVHSRVKDSPTQLLEVRAIEFAIANKKPLGLVASTLNEAVLKHLAPLREHAILVLLCEDTLGLHGILELFQARMRFMQIGNSDSVLFDVGKAITNLALGRT